ncbi:MAG: N-acetyltransferase [Ruminococcus sp.]|nr:N-acetyltransferase [Ruminococcus sp.]
MERIIKSMSKEYEHEALNLVEKVFTDYEDEENAKIVCQLIEEIRSMDTYVPELELIMVNEDDEIIGYAMFSKFHIEGKYCDDLLILTPVAVKTELQRQHISKELIEYGFDLGKKLGYKAVLVEGNPQNYNARGFRTSADYGIVAGESVNLPAPECLMVKELIPKGLENIKGIVEYTDYKSLI